MIDLLEKHRTIAERHARMLAAGANAVGLTNEKILSPTRAVIDGRETILAGTNNYMGLTFDADCIKAGQEAMAKFGTGTTGSRIANGTYALHKQLEAELAKFLNRKHCIVFTTGYKANLGMLAGLAGPKDTIYLDADSHSSIYDGCTLSGARLVRFRHNDATDLDKRLARSEGEEGGRLVVVEGIYSMMGDRAPLADFVAVKKRHGFQLLADEAHSFGVLGPHGRGLADEAGLEDEVDFVVGTFSKSVGAIGGFVRGVHGDLGERQGERRRHDLDVGPGPETPGLALGQGQHDLLDQRRDGSGQADDARPGFREQQIRGHGDRQIVAHHHLAGEADAVRYVGLAQRRPLNRQNVPGAGYGHPAQPTGAGPTTACGQMHAAMFQCAQQFFPEAGVQDPLAVHGDAREPPGHQHRPGAQYDEGQRHDQSGEHRTAEKDLRHRRLIRTPVRQRWQTPST